MDDGTAKRDDHDGTPPDGLTPEEASRIIHSHRKVRYGTACWPCRQRKVKCDNKQPCQNCVRRDHAQLCSYKPTSRPDASAHTSTAAASESGLALAAPKKRAHSPGGPNGSSTSASRRHRSAEAAGDSALPVDTDSTEMSRYLGQNSIPALLREQASPSQQEEGVEVIRQDMRSILGLDNSAPFPLMSARQLDRLTLDIAAELPSDREVMKLFHAYKQVPHPFWGFVLDINELESKLMVYLEGRAKYATTTASGARPPPAKPVSASWLAVLFSVLAVGAQYHDSPYHVRTHNAQKYIQISFHFLRIGNFLLRPNLDSIQALLLTGFVLLNDMKAEASWALLGLITRLAQSLGLDRAQPYDGKECADKAKKDYLRKRLWWTIVWHDCLTSLSFDRSPMTAHTACPIPVGLPAAGAGDDAGWTYLEGMYHLCQIIGNRLSPDAVATTPYEQILRNCDDVEAIPRRMVPRLRSKEACRSAIDRLHHYAIRLHTAFVVSVCCRPALRRGGGGGGKSANVPLTAAQKALLASKCRANLAETVRMFLAMHQLSVIPTRSWAFTYHGLSSAVLLGILEETKEDPEVRGLQGDLISALSATAAKEQRPSAPPHIQHTDRDIELSGPLSRALMALRNIYNHGNIAGQVVVAGRKGAADGGAGVGAAAGAVPVSMLMTTEGADGAAVDGLLAGSGLVTSQDGSGGGILPAALTTVAPSGLNPLMPPEALDGGMPAVVGSGKMDPHRDAALAMAEMQNGSLDLGMVPPIPPAATGADGMPDLSNIDTSTYLSPMDLYDQIFWENPEPWNMGADTMNFDFMAQPPQGQAQQQFYF